MTTLLLRLLRLRIVQRRGILTVVRKTLLYSPTNAFIHYRNVNNGPFLKVKSNNSKSYKTFNQQKRHIIDNHNKSTKYKKLFVNASIISLLLFGYITYNIHNSPPFAPLSEMLFNIKKKKIIKSHSVAQSDKYNFITMIKAMEWFVENGEQTASQLCIFKNDKEIFNFYCYNDDLNKNVDDTALYPIFSSTKCFAAFLIAKAVDMNWIKSYDDLLTDYWPEFDDDGNNITISDVLRHDAGLPYFKNDNAKNKISLRNTTYKDIATIIESHKPFIPNKERAYHAIVRGYILNELFHRIEPNGQYMNEYYINQILDKLSTNDKAFMFTLNGTHSLKNFDKHKTVCGDIILQSITWLLYHYVIPFMVLRRDTSLNKNNIGTNCIYLKDKKLYPRYRLHENAQANEVLKNLNEKEINSNNPSSISKYFRSDNEMAMEHMSMSGYTNAHSMAKLASYMINNAISKETAMDAMTNGVTTKFECLFLEEEVSMTKGGFGEYLFGEEKWHGWSGWGGSFLLYNKKYDCIVAYTTGSFARPGYIFPEPRSTVIINLVNELLKN